MSIEYLAFEAGRDRFVRLDKKGNFIGKQALIDWQDKGFRNAFVTLEVHGVEDADARGSEPIYKDGKVEDCTTSGGYAWRTGKWLAPGLVDVGLREIGTGLEIEILGELFKATVIEESPYDPQNEKLRA